MAPPAGAAMAHVPPDADPPSSDAATIRVLVVDDEHEIVVELLDALAQHRIDAIAARDGETGLAVLNADHAVTVVLTDLNMPGMNGLTFAERALTDRPPTQAIEVVILTGHATIQYAVDALRTRVFDFVRKPPRVAELIASLRRAHEAAMARRSARQDAADIETLRADLKALRDQAWADQLRLAEAVESAGLSERTQQNFLSLISHELRTPLVPIIGFAELIEQNTTALPETALKEYAQFIREGAETLSDLTRSILDLTQLTAAAASLRIAPCMPARLLEALHRRFTARLAAKSLRLTLDCDSAAMLATDRERLMQALGHMLSNVIRFATPGGSVTLCVQGSDNHMEFSVIDGEPAASVPTSALPADYRPFREIAPEVARQLGGIGLDLSLCALLADQLGGQMLINCARDRGTDAVLRLPLRQPAA
ncbi:MAG: hybrid sensor histidine kinase/response regulator [Rhodospirillales bacterium]|nr:hybrid sensor histidine kinase/response regulator [Rhodospirillales bacterium]